MFSHLMWKGDVVAVRHMQRELPTSILYPLTIDDGLHSSSTPFPYIFASPNSRRAQYAPKYGYWWDDAWS